MLDNVTCMPRADYLAHRQINFCLVLSLYRAAGLVSLIMHLCWSWDMRIVSFFSPRMRVDVLRGTWLCGCFYIKISGTSLLINCEFPSLET